MCVHLSLVFPSTEISIMGRGGWFQLTVRDVSNCLLCMHCSIHSAVPCVPLTHNNVWPYCKMSDCKEFLFHSPAENIGLSVEFTWTATGATGLSYRCSLNGAAQNDCEFKSIHSPSHVFISIHSPLHSPSPLSLPLSIQVALPSPFLWMTLLVGRTAWRWRPSSKGQLSQISPFAIVSVLVVLFRVLMGGPHWWIWYRSSPPPPPSLITCLPAAKPCTVSIQST